MITEFDPAAEQEFVESVRRYLVEAGPLQATQFDAEVKRVIGLLLALPKIGTPVPGEYVRSRCGATLIPCTTALSQI